MVNLIVVAKPRTKDTPYQKFFRKMLRKYGVTTPTDIPEKKRRKFWNEVDKGWRSKDETAGKWE